jgi:hypothetical protein
LEKASAARPQDKPKAVSSAGPISTFERATAIGAHESRDKDEFDRQAMVQLVDHVDAVACGDRRQAGGRNVITGMTGAQFV